MRLAIALALVSTGLGFLTTMADEPTILPAPPAEIVAKPVASQEMLPSPVAKQFVIKCEIYAQDARDQSKLLAVPYIVVTDGQEGHIATEGERPFVTAVRPNDTGEVKPVITRIREGTTGTVTVQSLDEDKVHVDVSFSVSNITRTDVLQGSGEGAPATQAPLLKTDAWRVVRTLELGQTIEIRDTKPDVDSGRLIAKLSVDRIGADEAAITPIGATEPTDTNGEPSPVHAVVYSVDDLLEENARNLPAEQLQHTDFVLVMDMLLSQSEVEWNDDTSMRSLPEKRAIVVTQTQQGHQEIARVLRDKRSHVAEAKALLLR